MDMADLFRKGLQNLHKDVLDKNYKKRSLLSRKESFMNARRQTRDTLMYNKRNIDLLVMSPYITPESNKKKAPEPSKQKIDVPDKRWEKLTQWKEMRNRQKDEEKKHAKPIFKVCHIDRNIGLPNLENVNKEIKGKLIKPLSTPTVVSFAPANKKFNPPKNVKPVHIVKPVSRNVQPLKSSTLQQQKPVQSVKPRQKTETKINSQRPKNKTNSVKMDVKKPLIQSKEKPNNTFQRITRLNSKFNIQEGTKKEESTHVPKRDNVVGWDLHKKSDRNRGGSTQKLDSQRKYQKTPLKPKAKIMSDKSNVSTISSKTPIKTKQAEVFKTPLTNYVTPTSRRSAKATNKMSAKQNQGKFDSSIIIIDDDDEDVEVEKVVMYDDEEITLSTPIKKLRASSVRKSTKSGRKTLEMSNSVSDIGVDSDTLLRSSVPQNKDHDEDVEIEKAVIYDDEEITLSTPIKKHRASSVRKSTKGTRKTLQSDSVSDIAVDSSTLLSSSVPQKKTPRSRNNRKAMEERENLVSDLHTTPKNKTPRKSKSQNELVLSEKTPTFDTNKSPVYISPFVTISRGKDSARKEFHIRKSTGGTYVKTPDGKDFSNSTSPQAGADYFEMLLDNQISRIEAICDTWRKYEKDNDVSEEASCMINVTTGQSKLLITKKFEQFRSLILECKSSQFKDKPITCEDLHGFWDMIYQQVIDLDKRFENLERLKNNNWEEVIPDKKVIVQKRARGRPKKPTASSSSSIREMIKAARNNKTKKDVDVKVQLLEPKTPEPIKTLSPTRTSSVRRSLRVSLLRGSTIKRLSSPGLTMMKITQAIKSGDGLTPSKSILKTNITKSVKSHSKSVLFVEDKENTPKAANLNITRECRSLNSLTPMRRSKRNSKIS